MASRLLTNSFRLAVGRRSMSAGPSASAGEHAGGTRLWKILTAVVAVPGVVVCFVNANMMGNHEPERPEFVAYEHLRRRTKKFPWGDGNHGLFHNGHINPLPEGYEDEH